MGGMRLRMAPDTFPASRQPRRQVEVLIIGIDCATDDSKVGVTLADFDKGRASIRKAQLCSRSQSVAETVGTWLQSPSVTAILAIDAPLGWPEPLGRVLATHRAGAGLSANPNDMFRRAADRFIQQKLAKTPLDVGADRIARTAHAALNLLDGLRTRLRTPIPLAWSRSFTGIVAVEVYPAATLVAHGLRSAGYKKPAQVAERREIVAALTNELDLGGNRAIIERHADVLDAAICVLAAKDFLLGRAMPPANMALAQHEGWIWAAARKA